MSNKARVGILTFSDGREFVHRQLIEMNLGFQNRLRQRLEADGYEVVTGEEIVWSNEVARREAARLAQAGCDLTMFNFAVWAFPHLAAIASSLAPQPFLLFSNVNPQHPGLVAMLAAAGTLNQVGLSYTRVWGEIEDDDVYARVKAFVTAAGAVKRLRGETYGLFGGRPMGMYTAVSNPDQWMKLFGVDIEHIDQWEIVRLADEVPAARVEQAIRWLESWGNVHYDGKQLTPQTLERQVRSYYALRRMIDERHLDFCGIKAQPELTNSFCTMDVAEAFLNDPYDWEGPKPIIVCATEADSDAALTMEIMKQLSGTPALFADVRHYHQDLNIFDLVNSGEHATYFAGRSFDPAVNMPRVHFLPESPLYFPAGGAAVHHLAAPGKATFARLTRLDGRYWMAIIRGEFLQYSEPENQALMKQTTYEWPHAFAAFACSAEEFLSTYASNHIHALYGDWVRELTMVCDLLNIDSVVLGED